MIIIFEFQTILITSQVIMSKKYRSSNYGKKVICGCNNQFVNDSLASNRLTDEDVFKRPTPFAFVGFPLIESFHILHVLN